MKTIEIDDELYQYIASNTKFIGESASDILRRLLKVDANPVAGADTSANAANASVNSINNEPSQEVNSTDNGQEQSSSEVEQDATSLSAADDANEQIEQAAQTEHAEEAIEQDAEPAAVADGQDLFDLINKEELAAQRGAVGRFLLILSNLYRVHKGDFEQVLDIRCRDRLYFAKSEEELRQYGSSTKPKLIPNSGFWVITNSNTTKKKRMLTDVAVALGYAAGDAERIRELL